MKLSILLIAVFYNIISFSQSIDVRKSVWGATSTDVKKAELPLVPSFEKDSNFISQKQANKVISYKNVVVEKQLAQIDYYFRNDKLVSISFSLQQNKDTVFADLYAKIIQVQSIFNKLLDVKKMKTVYCWTYDNGSFKQLSRRTACIFADKITALELEKYGQTVIIVNRAIYVIGNERSLASFEFDIKNNDNKIFCWINFCPTITVEKLLQSTDF